MEKKTSSSKFLVSFDYSEGDIPVLIVSCNGQITSFSGLSAISMYSKLTGELETNNLNGKARCFLCMFENEIAKDGLLLVVEKIPKNSLTFVNVLRKDEASSLYKKLTKGE